ncbi:DUF1353 domain-containing protein [Pelagibacterium sp. H642]|uniref:DUF1353 domain-containing protein n=1 Tax=Pelagibacterium sp. H642 TaxID=1881069 RepID=UPI0028157FA9|nr:DUF1353 domain-containing protein [Pelagibacterium sp. H642]WMT90527.1 DUF1353 domain-containing protein [Pelagibacterium sp. H642]
MQHFDRFGGKLVLVLLDNKLMPSLKEGRSLWGLQRPLVYTTGDAGDTITVPAGFVTDLASVPRWAWTLIPPDGPWVKAAIIHDYLYDTGGTGIWKGHDASITRPRPYTRAEADAIMKEAMENRGVGRFFRTLIYLAVRIGGGPGWKESRAAAVTPIIEDYVTEND